MVQPHNDHQEQREFTHEDFMACLAYLGHEIRNPLSVISNSLSLLTFTGPTAAQRATIDSMNRQVVFIEGLVDGLSMFGSRDRPIRMESQPFDSIWERAKDLASPLFRERSIHLSEFLPSVPVVLTADGDRLVQVFANLLINSAKFTPSGGSVWMSAEPKDGFLEVRLADNGIGIPEEELPHVFEVFYQGCFATISGIAGNGLGLAIAKRLIEAQGGTIAVASKGLHQGAEFTVRFPLDPSMRG